ncbi:MAG: hypothetical protein KF784_08535 [Fimbriimonadaceae bacterium]|nr:hypothetical protein [Fimbriimonadaceae bacterium]
MSTEFYRKLVDLYAGDELPEELEAELFKAAAEDPELRAEMKAMKRTVDLLHNEPAPEMTEESYQRILIKLYTRGVDVQPKSPTPEYLQYYLPIQG